MPRNTPAFDQSVKYFVRPIFPFEIKSREFESCVFDLPYDPNEENEYAAQYVKRFSPITIRDTY